MHMTRRHVLAALAATPLLSLPMPSFGQQANSVGLEGDSVILNGKRRFLLGACIDYFRVPHELWRDRILKSKRAGMNTVNCYIPWNFHETEEGVFDFSGDRDLEKFIDISAELDMYFYPRVGPFTCGEWEHGSYPAWLATKGINETRAHDPKIYPFIRRWFEQLIPIFVKRQATRGGNVIMVQQENEYFFIGRPGMHEYQDFLIQTMRDLGLEVPITDCNLFAEDVRRPHSFQTINGFNAGYISRLRKREPDKPVIISEFYTQWLESFGLPEEIKPGPDLLRQQTFDALAMGVMPFYFMFHGGTNFGFWGSRSWPTDASFMLPRYFVQGPITEGGALNDTYDPIKSSALVVASIEELFAGTREAKSPVKSQGPIQVKARSGDRGILLFISANKRRGVDQSATPVITLPSERKLELSQAPSRPGIYPLELQIDSGRRIDFASAPLVCVSSNAVVVSADEGRDAVISMNGEAVEFKLGSEPQVLKAAGKIVLAVPTALAPRTWLADDRVILDAAYVGEKRGEKHECWGDEQSNMVRVLTADGTLAESSVPAAPDVGPTELTLDNWTSATFPEVSNQGQWRDIDGPTSVEDLKAYYGYTWYRARFTSDTARESGLMFTNATDRIHVYLNDKPMGIWGRGESATRDPLPVQLTAGENQFVFLCDNMGRSSEGSLIDRKGIIGPVYLDAKGIKLNWNEQPAPSEPPTQSWRFQTYASRMKPNTLSRVSTEFAVGKKQTLVISIRDVPQYAWIFLNGKLVSEFGGGLTLIDDALYNSYVVPNCTGKQTLEIVTRGEPFTKPEEHLFVTSCPEDRPLTNWAFRPWSHASNDAAPEQGMPVSWRTTFVRPKWAGPTFIEPRGLSKGHVFMNGRAICKYWHIGPQTRYYLPEPWMKDQNELVIFDEVGAKPEQVTISHDPRWPTRMVIA